MNAFFKMTEVSGGECFLAKLAKELTVGGIDVFAIDRSLVKDISNFTESHEAKETRELTEQEKVDLKEKTGWTEKQIAKCTIDADGTIHYKTDREDLEGKTSENGVPYERKTIEINGVKVEGVFPVFDSAFDAQLPQDFLQESNAKQFRECNRQLKDAVAENPDLRAQFTEEQLQDIEAGDTPEGYVWHHNEETGKMQLVKIEDHDRTQGGAAHTGGKALWGGGYGVAEGVPAAETMAQKQNMEVS